MQKSKFIGKKKFFNKKDTESEDESITEDLETILKKEKEKNIFLLHPDTKKKTDTKKKSSIKLSEKEEKNIIGGKEIDILNEIQKLNREINNLKNNNERQEKDINILKNNNKRLVDKNKKLEKNINALEDKNKKLEKNINALEDKNKKQEKNINALEAQNKRLDNEVKDLKKFLFSAKIRKLLKNLIEFIVNKFYPNHIKYSRSDKKIFFISAPRTLSTLKWAKEQEIVNALNRLLELLFSHSKQQDYVIHFVEPRVTRNNTLKQIFYVFNNPEQFFEYFKISNDDRKILKEIIPHNYFTIIDNLKFEVNVKELINNIAKNYV